MIGRVVAGRFELEREAGSGGMGTVYRARDLTDGRARSRSRSSTGASCASAQRFEREAAILAELSHPAIVRYVAHGVAEAGERFLAMEWLEGEDLARGSIARQTLATTDALFAIRRAAEALGLRARARHRPPRRQAREPVPAARRRSRALKVLDFGIARLTHGGRTLTRTGAGRSARRATWRPSRCAASATSTRAPTCSRWAACCSSA